MAVEQGMIFTTGKPCAGGGHETWGMGGLSPSRTPRSSRRAPSRSITLVELIVVLAVIGIVIGVGVPGFVRYANSMRLRSTTRQFVGLASLARSKAIGSRAEHAVVINVQEGVVRVVNLVSGEDLEQVVKIPNTLQLEMQIGGEAVAETRFVFRPSGSLQGRTVVIILDDGTKKHIVTVTSATGTVVVE